MLFDEAKGQQLEPCNIHQLKAYHYDERHTDPIVVRTKDSKDQFIVEKIISHNGRFNRKTHLTFTVKWAGYPTTTEEPWSNVRTNDQLHAYLRKIGKSEVIPKQFQT